MKKILFAMVIFLVGCGLPMTRSEQIRAIHECEKAGLKAQMVYSAWTNALVDVECVPKDHNTDSRVKN